MAREKLTAENLVEKHFTDHQLVSTIQTIKDDKVYCGSLNLLNRQRIRFRQEENQGEVFVQINCPLPWFLLNGHFAYVNQLLERENLKLRQFIGPRTLFAKKQLELVDILTDKIVKKLPEQQKIYLESAKDYYTRLQGLGEFIAREIYASHEVAQYRFFCVQELQNERSAFNKFTKALQSIMPSLRLTHNNKLTTNYMPAIIYNKNEMELLSNVSKNIKKNISAFVRELKKIVQGAMPPSYLGPIHIAAFKDKSGKIYLVCSYHGNFTLMNQGLYDVDALIEKLKNLAKKYEIIIAGDFNKILYENPITIRENVAIKSTLPGLQLHDTMDAIFTP